MIPLAINMTAGQSTSGQRFQGKISIFPSYAANTPDTEMTVTPLPVSISERPPTSAQIFQGKGISCFVTNATVSISKRDCGVETEHVKRHFSCSGVNVLSISSAEISKSPASTAMSNQIIHNTATTSCGTVVCQATTSTTELSYLLELIDRDFSDVDLMEKGETLDNFHVDVPYISLPSEKNTEAFGADERSVSASTSTDNTVQSVGALKHLQIPRISYKHASATTNTDNKSSSFKSIGNVTSEIPEPSRIEQMQLLTTEHCTGSQTIMVDNHVQYSVNDVPELNQINATTSANLGMQSTKTSRISVPGSRETKPNAVDTGIQYSDFAVVKVLESGHLSANLKLQSTKTSKNSLLDSSEPKSIDAGIQYSAIQRINEMNSKHVNAAASAHLRLQSTATSEILVRSAERKSVDSCIQYTGLQDITEPNAKRCASTGTCTCTAQVSTGLSPLNSPRSSIYKNKFDVHCQCQESNVPCRECASAGVNVNLGLELSKSFGQITSELRMSPADVMCKVDTEVQCVNHPELYVQRSARIGNSRLMSVFTLNSSIIEASTQSDPMSRIDGACYHRGLTSSAPGPPLHYEHAAIHSTSLPSSLQPTSLHPASLHPISLRPALLHPASPQPPALPASLKSRCSYTDGDAAVNSSLSIDNVGSSLDSGPILVCRCAHMDDCDPEPRADPNYLSVLSFGCPTCSFVRRTLNLPKAMSSHTTPRKNFVLQPPKSRSDNRDVEDRLVSLWRLISQRKSQSARTSDQMPNAVLSSKLNAAKWIKGCTFPVDKEFQSLLDLEQATSEYLNQDETEEADAANMSDLSSSKSPKYERKKSSKAKHRLSESSKPKLTNSAIPEPLLSLSKDSLADVLPLQETSIDRTLTAFQLRNVMMVDKVTSDSALFSKDVRELELQACPDICDAATDFSNTAVRQQKSASAITSRCVLSTPRCEHDKTDSCSNCLFVYDRPRCIVHKSKTDTGVQIYPSHHDVVYKALYETTKYIAKTDSKSYSIRSNFTNSIHRETENVARTRTHTPDKQSASVLTSRCGFNGSMQCSFVRDMATGQDSDILRQFPSNAMHDSTQFCSSCRARIMEAPRGHLDHLDSGSLEECVNGHMMGSCRYYTKLLTKQIGRVTNNLKHMSPDHYQWEFLPPDCCTEACTMKPSGRETLACQTSGRPRLPRPVSCCFLSPALSLTDICRGREQDLKSVYYMLTAIEGRIRRLKRNIPT